MKRFSKLFSFLAAFCVLFSSVSVYAAESDLEFESLDQILAEWNGNIDTEWSTVYGEYKLLTQADKDKADKVIAVNAYRFLLSSGSAPLVSWNDSSFNDFMKAVSPFNLAYNSFVAEAVVHAAWTISSDEYKIFAANVIHNILSSSDYYTTHVIQVNDFSDLAAKGLLNFQYNDYSTYNNNYGVINIADNIFYNNVLSASGTSVGGFYFNSSPSNFTGTPFTLANIFELNNYFINRSDYYYFTNWCTNFNSNSYIFGFRVPSSSDLLIHNFDRSGLFIYIIHNSLGRSFVRFYFDKAFYTYPSESSSPYIGGGNTSFTTSDTEFSYNSVSDSYNAVYDFFNLYKNRVVYCTSFNVVEFFQRTNEYRYYNLPLPIQYSSNLLSPQFEVTNIYNNTVYRPTENTYYQTDYMYNNIINNDYSSTDNSVDNTFYYDNYFYPVTNQDNSQTLVTNNNITYNYTTIINNNGGGSGGSESSGPYDVRIINPEDIRNDTIINENQHILNEYEFNLGDLNISTGVSSAADTISDIFDSNVDSDNTQEVVSGFVNAFPSDLLLIVFGLFGVGIIIGVIKLVIGG